MLDRSSSICTDRMIDDRKLRRSGERIVQQLGDSLAGPILSGIPFAKKWILRIFKSCKFHWSILKLTPRSPSLLSVILNPCCSIRIRCLICLDVSCKSALKKCELKEFNILHCPHSKQTFIIIYSILQVDARSTAAPCTAEQRSRLNILGPSELRSLQWLNRSLT